MCNKCPNEKHRGVPYEVTVWPPVRHRYSGCDVWYRGCVVMPEVDVTSQILWFGVIEWVRCHVQCKGCHTYAECCVINTECSDVSHPLYLCWVPPQWCPKHLQWYMVLHLFICMWLYHHAGLEALCEQGPYLYYYHICSIHLVYN